MCIPEPFALTHAGVDPLSTSRELYLLECLHAAQSSSDSDTTTSGDDEPFQVIWSEGSA